jgi:hypothetical protein
MNKLGPLLPEACKTGLVPITTDSDPPGLVLDGNGCLTRNGLFVEKDAVTGQPRAVIGPDEQSLRKVVRQIAGDRELPSTRQRAASSDVAYHNHLVIAAEIEVAAMKSLMLTFDHLLAGAPHRFTRDAALQQARDFIRTSIMDGQIDGRLFNHFSLGLQYEKEDLYRGLRSSVSFPTTRFEHVMIVSADPACRTVDAVWLMFGFDPHGFRLCYDWRGVGFTYVFVNGVLRDTGCSSPFGLPKSQLLCRPTNRRAFPNATPNADLGRRISEEVSARRRKAYIEALWLVEETCDEFCRHVMCEDAMLEEPANRAMDRVVSRRLTRMYVRIQSDHTFTQTRDALLAKELQGKDGLLCQSVLDSSGAGIDWPWWLAVYRRVLHGLEAQFGPPGDIFLDRAEVGLDRTDTRLLGAMPPTKPSSRQIRQS